MEIVSNIHNTVKTSLNSYNTDNFNTFHLRRYHHKQVRSPILSAATANIFMNYLEKKAIDGFYLKQNSWLRHEDAVFVIWSHLKDIQFTPNTSIAFTKETKNRSTMVSRTSSNRRSKRE